MFIWVKNTVSLTFTWFIVRVKVGHQRAANVLYFSNVPGAIKSIGPSNHAIYKYLICYTL